MKDSVSIKFTFLVFLILTGITSTATFAQLPPAFTSEIVKKAEVDPLKRTFLSPQRVVWVSNDSLIKNPEVLLNKGDGQAFFGKQELFTMVNKDRDTASVILDFGIEIHGGIQITTSTTNTKTARIRVRFGESVSEASSETMNIPISEDGATNHHSLRDFDIALPGYGTVETGSSGFRFVRIDLLDGVEELRIKEIRAAATFRDIPYRGSFKCDDERLNQIWQTGAYTVHLNMQQYLWDGIKRDRMVWSGDLHPEVMTISSVFGKNDIVPESLDLLRDNTPLPEFINGISSYSMWWVIMQYDWYMYHGDQAYLEEQKEYLISLLDLFTTYVDQKGREQLYDVGMRFLNWPSSRDEKAIHAGLQALLAMTFERGAKLCETLNETDKAEYYMETADKMKSYKPDPNNSKEAASLLALADMLDPEKANKNIISVGGPKKFSAFFGYYMLLAQAKAGDYNGALDNIRKFWGGMLDLGATTFWEEFDLEEAKNAASIAEIVPPGKLDYHKNTGDHCYIGYRRSLCHGWASGPTPWLSEMVLGIKVLEPGCRKIKIEPHLGDLKWVEGTFPTPLGVLQIKHTKMPNGEIKSEIDAPEGITIIN